MSFWENAELYFVILLEKNGHKIWFVCFIRKAINDPKKTVKKLY